MSLMTVIEIPLKEQHEVIELDVNDLPPVEEVINILTNELSALNIWINVAHAYYKKRQYIAFESLMEAALKTNAGRQYSSYEKDYLRALDLLAIYYVQRSLKEKNKDSRRQLFQMATRHLQAADKIAMYDQNHLLNRAFFFLAEGGESANQADNQLQFVLNQVPNCVPALLGKACVAFNRRDYRAALHLYRRALRTQPNCPASVRVGIGHCFVKQGKPERARQAYMRALELDPECVGALVGLALLNLNEKTQESIKEGVQLLSRAYQLDNTNPMVLNHLADHFFYKKEMDKVHRLALHAYHSTENEAMRAESCYHMARAHHAQGNYDRAFQYYYQATQFSSSLQGYTLPHYGLAQMYLHKSDTENAALAFEKVLQNNPKNYETLKILGSLYAQSDKPEKRQLGRQYLKQVTETHPDDVEVWIEYAQLLENDSKNALEAYTRAIAILEEEGLPVPAEILNNVGCLYYQLGDADQAQSYYERALARCDAEVDTDERYFKGLKVTMTYNLARLYEMKNRTDVAENYYKSILREHSNYIDCHLRLGCIARDRGQIDDAFEMFKEALRMNQENPNVWSLIGLLHLAKNEGGPAQKKFERITSQESHRDDPFAQVALGNIWLNTLHHPLRDRERERRHQERALALYKAVLRQRPRNQWAANGIGCVLAHRGLITEARDVFAQVREATADFPDVWINIAHIYVEQKQFIPAVQMYENCIKKFGKHNNTELLLYLARAYFKAGKLLECKQTLLKAHHVSPTDQLLLFNVAFVQKKIATSVLQNEKSTITAVLSAVTDLKLSQRIFSYLSDPKNDPSRMNYGLNANNGETPLANMAGSSTSLLNMAKGESRDVADLVAQAKYHVNRAKKLDDQEKNIRMRQENEREALRKRQMELQQQNEALRIERETKLEEERKILAAKARLIAATGMSEEREKKNRKAGGGGGSRKRRADADDGLIASDGDSYDSSEAEAAGDAAARKKSKLERKQRKHKEFKEKSKSNRKSSGKKSRGGAANEELEDGLTSKQRSRVVSKATVSSSEEDASSSDENVEADLARKVATSFAIDEDKKKKVSRKSSSSSSSDSDKDAQSDSGSSMDSIMAKAQDSAKASPRKASGRRKRVRGDSSGKNRKGGKKRRMDSSSDEDSGSDNSAESEKVTAAPRRSNLLASSDSDEAENTIDRPKPSAAKQAMRLLESDDEDDQNDAPRQTIPTGSDQENNQVGASSSRPPWADMSSDEDDGDSNHEDVKAPTDISTSQSQVVDSSQKVWKEVAHHALLSSDEESD